MPLREAHTPNAAHATRRCAPRRRSRPLFDAFFLDSSASGEHNTDAYKICTFDETATKWFEACTGQDVHGGWAKETLKNVPETFNLSWRDYRWQELADRRGAYLMDRNVHLPWKLPSPDALPETDATLEQIIRFARLADPTAHFHDRWGEEYRTNVETLWHRCVQSYKAGHPAADPPDELLMCLAYDVILGPHLGVPDADKLPFLRWLIDGVRRGLRGSGMRDEMA